MVSPRTLKLQQKEPPIKSALFWYYRDLISDKFSKRVRQSTNGSVISTNRKLMTCLPSFKSPFPSELKSQVVYQIDCPGCNASYVGQTYRHLTTLGAHREPSARVGSHFIECGLAPTDIDAKIIDSANNKSKLLKLEALHIAMKNPQLNARVEYRHRELTLRL